MFHLMIWGQVMNVPFNDLGGQVMEIIFYNMGGRLWIFHLMIWGAGYGCSI